MTCPHCRTVDLTMTERQGVEIDYCPQCRGVWLDRGELDKLIERAARYDLDDDDDDERRGYREDPRHRKGPHGHQQYQQYQQQHYKKRKSWWQELFD